MTYIVFAEITPPGIFGVPDGTKLVYPSGPTELVSAALDSSTLRKVGYGTMPRYREDEDAVRVSFTLDGLRMTLNDNYLMVVCDLRVASHSEALSRVSNSLNRLMESASVQLKQHIAYELVSFRDDAGNAYPLPRFGELISFTAYDTRTLCTSISRATLLSTRTDARLDRALIYYRHALMLIANQGLIAKFGTPDFDVLASAIVLNLWKAVSVIIGDPSVDRDYQRRYRTFGISYEYFSNEIEPLRRLRDSSDVAHHAVDVERQKRLQTQFGPATAVASTVLNAYQESLLAGQIEIGDAENTQ